MVVNSLVMLVVMTEVLAGIVLVSVVVIAKVCQRTMLLSGHAQKRQSISDTIVCSAQQSVVHEQDGIEILQRSQFA